MIEKFLVPNPSINENIYELGDFLHHQLDKAVILPDVSLQNILARTQHTFKPGTVQLYTLQCAFGLDCSCTRSLEEQSNFTWMTENEI